MKRLLCLFLSVIAILNCFILPGFAEAESEEEPAPSEVCITDITPVEPAGKSITLAVKQERQLLIKVSPESAKEQIHWFVADKKIAAVTSDGLLTGKKTGKTTLTVAATDGSQKSITYKVNVTARKIGNNLSTKSCTVVNTKKTKYSYEQLCKDLKNLQKKYPNTFEYGSLGKSYDKRDIFEIVLGNPDAKNKVLVQATIHAREYNNSVLVMKQVETLCANYYQGTYKGIYYSELLQNCCFYIIPMSNPDGVSISIHGASGIRDKKLRSKVTNICKKYGGGSAYYYTQWKANARGVDLNRNWACNWKSLHAVSHACSEGYKGPYAHSEKETKILKKVVERLQPKAVISYHSTGSIIYWDFIQKGALQRKCFDLFQVTRQLTGYASADNPSAAGYTTSKLSPCFGDWVVNMNKIPELTIETGTVYCPISAKYFPQIWEENKHVLPAVAYFSLNDTAVNIASGKARRGGFSITTRQQNSKNLTYQLCYYPDSRKDAAIYEEFSANSGSWKVSGLKAKTTYCMRMRTIKKYGSIRIYGRWSETIKVKTK